MKRTEAELRWLYETVLNDLKLERESLDLIIDAVEDRLNGLRRSSNGQRRSEMPQDGSTTEEVRP
jgi:hypothetical protein